MSDLMTIYVYEQQGKLAHKACILVQQIISAGEKYESTSRARLCELELWLGLAKQIFIIHSFDCVYVYV